MCSSLNPEWRPPPPAENVPQPSREPSNADLLRSLRLDSTELYLNPHLSLLAFQRRVLDEAKDPATPLLERVKFLSILGSNMDEFFMVRVAGLWQQIETRTTEISMDGRSPSEQLELIRHEVTSIMGQIYQLWLGELMPELRAERICILGLDESNPQQKVAVDDYFRRVVYPVLTPLAVDQGRPFPHISNLSLNIAAVVTSGDGVSVSPASKSRIRSRSLSRCLPKHPRPRLSGWKTP